MKGYKAFDSDLTCHGFQYEIGKEYTFDGAPIICKQGFHFCGDLVDCYDYYPTTDSTRICEVEVLGDVVSGDDGLKFCTNRIKIIREIPNPRAKTNASSTSTGYCNAGSRNSGSYNSGRFNSGSYNVGDHNAGRGNNGCYNTGNSNVGCFNSGNRNVGDWNTGSYNCGYFNTTDSTIRIFNKKIGLSFGALKTINDAMSIMYGCPVKPELRQEWWDKLPVYSRYCVMKLPCFDSLIFKECTGIEVGVGDYRLDDLSLGEEDIYGGL